MFGPWTPKSVLRECSFWGPEGQKRAFYLHFLQCSLACKWKAHFLIKKHESVLDCEKRVFFGRGLDLGSCRFWAEGENPCIFTVFLLFFIKSAKACEANFHRCWLQFFWQPEPKKEPFWFESYMVFWLSEKKGFAKPLIFRGGGGCEPQENQKGPNPAIFIVFSCLAQNQ